MTEPVSAGSDLLRGLRRLHLVGVAGAGMSALAKLTFQSGLEVSGSDLRDGIELAALADLGVTTWAGHRPEFLEGVELVVASSAIPDNDPELVAAVGRGIEVWRRPRLLQEITRSLNTIGPTGTHGKTTTSALMVTGLRATGIDPSFVIGGDLQDLGTNAHLGADPPLVLEADEAFGTFELLNLRGLVVTNVEPEHLDYFETADQMENTFVEVARRVVGPVVCCLDDPGSLRVAQRTGAVTYGFEERAAWHLTDLTESGNKVSFLLRSPQGSVNEVEVPRPGRHVALNAAGALVLLGELGHDLEKAARGLATFAGVKRRFELRGNVGGVTLIDDYAHHPTEVAAVIRAARSGRYRRIWAVFQPHLFSRTKLLYREFGVALAGADRIVVTDVYAAREEPIPGVTGDLVADAARRAGAQVQYVSHRADVARTIAPELGPGDLVLSMGAGDITLLSGEIAALLSSRSSR
ncbi:MAG TPA: UDP-N-acetylmuramate--L-alanine ligase [Acidimicrobiia bacterium]|nr:UDP-N-acetylmuramate--L-alanine ligase [Acidimicrobiia bacterium]